MYAYLPARLRSEIPNEEQPRIPQAALVVLMPVDDVDVPLWTTETGLLFDDVADFIAFGAAPDLAHDLAAWAEDRQRNGRGDESDLAALRLLDRLRQHFDYDYQFAYRP